VIVRGPSGSGKTTLPTLIGALRSAQDGRVRILGRELRAASARNLANIRKHVGYIFQPHNLIDALTARQNVEMALRLHRELSRGEVRDRSHLEPRKEIPHLKNSDHPD
jgi:putative ABC transport system ATP-binding protein